VYFFRLTIKHVTPLYKNQAIQALVTWCVKYWNNNISYCKRNV